MVKKNFSKFVLGSGLLLGLSASAAFAQTVAVTPGSVNGLVAGGATDPGSVQVVFTNGGAVPPSGFQVDVAFDPAIVTVTRTASNPGGGDQLATCNIIAGAGTGGLDVVRVVVANLNGDPAVDGNYCTLNLSVVANTPAGTYPLAVEGAVNLVNPTGSQIVVSAAPPTPLTLSYNPAPGALILPSGNAGTTVSRDIIATAAGNSGTASLSCTAAAGFTVTPNLTFNAAGDQNIAVGCTLGASVVNGNITCTEIDGDSVAPGATRTWTATCPQGGVVPVNPTITTVTATGAFAMPSGALGQTVSRLIDFSASGGAGTGSATINCTATAPVTVTPAMQTVTGSAQPTDVAVRLQLTNADQGPFDVVCTVTSGSTVRTDTFNVTASAGTALPPPTVVPASSTWSQLLLIALMAGLGLAFVGFRRQS